MHRPHTAGYLLIVLVIVSILVNADYIAFGLLLQNIKIDLHLTDTQLGVLTGAAAALGMSIVSIPIARWADRGNRVAIIAISVALWSVLMALCAVVRSFPQLLWIRIGVAASGVGVLPASISLIADQFNRAERPRAFARYALGVPMSLFIGDFVGGWLSQMYDWRLIFALLSLLGLLAASLVWFSLREPRVVSPQTDQFDASRGNGTRTLKKLSRNLVINATFRHLLAYWVLSNFFCCGIGQFQPAFLLRSYGMTSMELGTWFALINGVGGLVVTYLGGEWASRHAANNESLQLRTAGFVWSCLAVSLALLYLSTDRYVAFGLLALINIGAVTAGPLNATLQSLVPPRDRATAFALVSVVSALIGGGLGPLAAGALSDALRPWLAEESLRYASLALCPGYLWCGWHLWRASKTIVQDLKVVQDDGVPSESLKQRAAPISVA